MLERPDGLETSRSSVRPIAFGETSTGRLIAVVYEEINDDTVYPITAYEVEMKRIKHNRRRTPEEAAKYNAIREAVEQEKPEINARIRKRMAARRKSKARKSGERTFGQCLRAARESLGESQVNVAAAAGISQGYLSQLENDEREPTLSIAARLAKALNVSLDELASGAA